MVTARFLLDTNALREPVRDTPDPAFMRQFQLHMHSLAIPAPGWHESLYGLAKLPAGKYRERVEDFLFSVLLPSVEILPYDGEAARYHAEERARLDTAGTPVGFADGQVAAVAARFDLTLVTNNERHLARFQGIRVANWMSQRGPGV